MELAAHFGEVFGWWKEGERERESRLELFVVVVVKWMKELSEQGRWARRWKRKKINFLTWRCARKIASGVLLSATSVVDGINLTL